MHWHWNCFFLLSDKWIFHYRVMRRVEWYCRFWDLEVTAEHSEPAERIERRKSDTEKQTHTYTRISYEERNRSEKSFGEKWEYCRWKPATQSTHRDLWTTTTTTTTARLLPELSECPGQVDFTKIIYQDYIDLNHSGALFFCWPYSGLLFLESTQEWRIYFWK